MRNIACMLLALWGISSPANAQPTQDSPAIPVGVITAERKPVTKSQDFVGRVEAVSASRSGRGSPAISSRAVQGRRIVKEARRSTASKRACSRPRSNRPRARWSADKAAKTLTESSCSAPRNCWRKARAPRSRAIRRSRPTRRPRARFSIDEANLQTAKINLGYTDIIAPIAGKVGKTNVTKGNVVGPDSGVADAYRQPGPDVCDVPGQPARIPARAAGGRSDRRHRRSRSSSASPTARRISRPARSTSSTSRSTARPTPCWCAPPCPIRTAR